LKIPILGGVWYPDGCVLTGLTILWVSEFPGENPSDPIALRLDVGIFTSTLHKSFEILVRGGWMVVSAVIVV
jgi:hypothetical protein